MTILDDMAAYTGIAISKGGHDNGYDEYPSGIYADACAQWL